MLRAYLRDELRRQGGGVQEAAEQTTARWYLAHGRDLLAVRHATRAGDADLLDDVVGRVGPGLVAAGRGDGLLEALTPPVPRSSGRAVWTPLVRALALADAGRLDESLVELAAVPSAPPVADRDEAEQARHLDLAAAHETMRLQIRRRRGEPILRAELMGASAAPSPDLALLLTAEQGSCLLRLGDLAAATTKLEKAIELARNGERVAALVDCLSILGGIQGARCDLPAMMTSLEEAVALAESHGLATDRRMALPRVLLGWGLFQRLDDDAARLSLPAGLEPAGGSRRPDRETPRPDALLDRPGCRPLREQLGRRTARRAARRRLARHRGLVRGALAGRLPGRHGGPDTHHAAAGPRGAADPGLRPRQAGRVRRAGPGLGDGARGDGRRGEARALLTSVTGGEVAPMVALTQGESYALSAALACLDDDHFSAGAHARDALRLADELGRLRPLVDVGESFHEVLRSGRGRWGEHEAIAERVLRHSAQPSLPTISLTARELEILRELPSLATAEEIASTLFVSVNTVKTHLRSVYRKLGVDARRRAVVEARRLGLL